MEMGGNQRAKEFLKKHGKEAFEDYNGTLANKYKKELEDRVNKRSGNSVTQVTNNTGVSVQVEQPEVKETPKAVISDRKIEEVKMETTIKPLNDDGIVKDTPPVQNLTKKTFNVKFNTKFNKNKTKKTGLAAQKIDEELDFNKMFLGDQVTNTNTNTSSSKVNDADQFFSSKQEREKETPTYSNDYREDSNTKQDMEKYKNMQGIGSDMLNDNNAPNYSINSYGNCQALSSDQLFGKNEGSNEKSGIGEYISNMEWEDKIRNAKDLIANKSTSIYNKLRDKWNGYN